MALQQQHNTTRMITMITHVFIFFFPGTSTGGGATSGVSIVFIGSSAKYDYDISIIQS